MEELKKALAGMGYTKAQANQIILTIECMTGNFEVYQAINDMVMIKRDAQEEAKALQEKLSAITGLIGDVAAPAPKKAKPAKVEKTPLEKQIETGSALPEKKTRKKKSETEEEIKDNVRSLGDGPSDGGDEDDEKLEL